MSYIATIGTSIPEYHLKQMEIKKLVKEIFSKSDREIERLLPVFDHANIFERQFVVDSSWFLESHSFKERNKLYKEKTIVHSLHAIDECLSKGENLTEAVPYHAIDAIIFVSSTGISTPSIDAHLINERNFREDIVRIPLWGLGCAGGVNGLARAHEWLSYYTNGAVLLVNVELCSLTFQKDDDKKSNFIGTALFGDGVSATLVLGEQSPYLTKGCGSIPSIKKTSTRTKKNALDVMGWDITNNGFEVVFAKSIPQLVRTFWKQHVFDFLYESGLSTNQIPFYVAHPGGKKVLEAMEEVLQITREHLHYSYQILENHGNMSSVTIFYILKEWMKEDVTKGTKSIISALGPGFSSELISLEWE
ncbi:type III polyketide synthase [Aquibacillus albus]|uniref:Alkylresorcinol/alkylpyrone synthase n=1 Tax=Aquibacillus albus TaxID=1168171 RepID=A0ABS2MVE0_9BACI|nr:3-oxoacyl-[acyl-carrier-protein] synthase III C-terminal domain-containing protein [Aquibacillus albus]MBM7569874.1 alkylresorcinol/alkylpyrone synthase [Aquibacillus albus]